MAMMLPKMAALALAAMLSAPVAAPAQADLHLYHQAWYQERVARSPRRALELYARLCRDFPDSPLRRFALGRQAELLIRLGRPERARPILEELERTGFGEAARKDQETLAWAMRTLATRRKLLDRIRELRRKHDRLKQELARLQRGGGTAAERAGLAARIDALERELGKLRPQLEKIIPQVLRIKRLSMEGGLTSRAARKQIERISMLKDQARALQEEGKLEEAARVRAQAESEERAFRRRYHRGHRSPGRKTFKRLIQSLRDTPLARLKSTLERKPLYRLMLLRLVTSPERLKKLDGPLRKRVMLSLGILAEGLARRLDREKKEEDAARIRALWRNLQDRIRRGDYRGARAPLGELGRYFRKHSRFRRPPRRRPPQERPRRTL